MYYRILWLEDRIHCCTLLLSIGRFNSHLEVWKRAGTGREVDGQREGEPSYFVSLLLFSVLCILTVYVYTTTQGSKSQVWIWAVLSQLKWELNIRKLYVKAKFCLFFKSRPADPPQTDQLLQWVFRWKTPNLIFSFWRNWKTHSTSTIKLWPDNSLSNRTY